MKKLLIITLCILQSGQVVADSFRCGRTIVKSGDSSAALIRKCGEPERKFSSKEIIDHDGQKIRAGVSNWVYTRKGKKDMVVMIYSGVIAKMRIE